MLPTDPGFFTQVLTSPAFEVVQYRDRYVQLSERLGVDFSAIIFALTHIPLCLRGEEHAQKRRAVARLLAEGMPRFQAALPGVVAEAFAGLSRPGAHDLLAEAVLPCVDNALTALIGVRLDMPVDSYISRVFSQSIGIAKRRRMETQIGDLTARLRASFPGDDEDLAGCRLALAILGRDALIGSLAGSLNAHLVALDGAPLNSAPLVPQPTHTGVPYVDRSATAPTRIGAREFVPGDAVRVRLDAFEAGGTEADRMKFFGAGGHVCLGRPATLKLWEAVAARLAATGARVRVTGYALRKDDVFNFPETFTVEVA